MSDASSMPLRYAELRPDQFLERLNRLPLAYLPLGTLEWHGLHLPLGADSLQAEHLMLACAERWGGIVMPPLFLGPDRRTEGPSGESLIGMDTALSTQPPQVLPGSAYWVSGGFFLALLDAVLEQLRRAGFKAVFADGHGPSRRYWVQAMPTLSARHGLRLGGVTADWKDSWTYMTDHAGRNETSILLHARPDLVDLSPYGHDHTKRPLGVNGEHPLLASADEGRQHLQRAVERVGGWIAGATVDSG